MGKLVLKERVLNEDELEKIRKGELMPMPEVLLKDDAALEAVLHYVKKHLRKASKAEKKQISRMVERYLGEAEERERINTKVTNTFHMYAGKARRVIPIAGGVAGWLGTGNMTLAFMTFAGLFVLFGPLAQKVIDTVGEAGKTKLEKARGKLLASVRPR